MLLTSLTLESELRIKSHLQKLLTVAKNLFSHLGKINIPNFILTFDFHFLFAGDVTDLLRQIMSEARHLTQVTRSLP